MQTYDEPLDCDLLIGDKDYVEYVKSIYSKGEKWTELIVEMQDVLVHRANRPPFIGPYMSSRNLYLTGSCLNLRDHEIDQVDLRPGPRESVAEDPGYRNYHINGVGYQIYGHWLLDFLPRIFLAEKHARYLGCIAHIFMPLPPNFAIKILKLLNVNCRFTYFNQPEPIILDRVLAVPSMKLGARYSRNFVGETFKRLKIHRDANANHSKYILVGRRKAPMAKNFNALQNMLLKRGFEVIYPEDYGIQEQISIFKAARVIVGEDGSAMHNVGFCDPGAKVVITARSSRRNVWHVSVTQYASIKLAYLASAVRDDSYDIDLAAVERALDDQSFER